MSETSADEAAARPAHGYDVRNALGQLRPHLQAEDVELPGVSA